MAGLDFLHNNITLEQNTRLSQLFSGANFDHYASFDSFFGQASNDPFAQVQGLEFDTARFRTENSFEAIQQDFTAIHNQILNIETEISPVMVAYEAAASFGIDSTPDSFDLPPSFNTEILPDFAPLERADSFSFFDAASGEVLSFSDDSFAAMPDANLYEAPVAADELVQELYQVAPDYAEPVAILDSIDSFAAMPDANLYEIQVSAEEMVQDVFETFETYAEPIATIDLPLEAPVEISVNDHFADVAWQSSAMVIDTPNDHYEQSYTQSLFENVLNDMQIGAWNDMVLHNPADLDYAAANNDPLNNILSEEIVMNDDGYSSAHSDLQNLTSY